jgi:hypothetical protein
MAEVKVTVKGVDALTVKLLKFSEDVENAQVFGNEIGRVIVADASAMAPKRSGALAASIGSTVTSTGIQVYAGSESVPYAGVIEFGWPRKNISSQPYLTPAVYNNMDSIVRKYEDGISKTIKKYNLD